MKTAIVYYSKHHGNTKKLLDAIASQFEVTLIDVTEQPDADLSSFDRVGFASGIYYSSFAKQLQPFCGSLSARGQGRLLSIYPRCAEGRFFEGHAGHCGKEALPGDR